MTYRAGFAELGLQFAKYGEGASDIKERDPKSKPSPGTYSGNRRQRAVRVTVEDVTAGCNSIAHF